MILINKGSVRLAAMRERREKIGRNGEMARRDRGAEMKRRPGEDWNKLFTFVRHSKKGSLN